MTFSAYLTIILANLVGAMSPGPDVILITRLATKSRRHAVAAACGIQVGVLFWITLTVLGASALLTAVPELLGLVQTVGGAWLLYMGQKMVRGGLITRKYPPADLAEVEGSLGRLRHSFVLGMTTNLANPKAVLFFAALIAPLLPPHPSVGTALLLIASLAVTTWMFFLFVSMVISTHRVRSRMLAAGPWIDIAAGIFFVVAGLALVVHGLAEIVS